MEPIMSNEELLQNVLVHLYNSAVSGTLRSIYLTLRMQDAPKPADSRLSDLQALYELMREDQRLFYAATTAIAEFAVYRVLDFIETYNRFDSEHNEEEFPHLSLSFMNKSPEGDSSVTLSKYGSERLGQVFKRIARSNEMRSLVESIIDKLVSTKQIYKERGKLDH